MSPRPRQIRFSDGNREALIIRFRAILILGLIDFFNNDEKFSKIIIREIMDLSEGIIKALAESLSINIRNRSFRDIFNDIQHNRFIPLKYKNKIIEINDSLSANELNSIRVLFRNPDSHTLNLPTVPQEPLIRCWRMIKDLIGICDSGFMQYEISRPEFKDFYNLYHFFFNHVIDEENIDWIDIKTYKLRKDVKLDRGKIKEFEIEMERTTSQIIEYISSGKYI